MKEVAYEENLTLWYTGFILIIIVIFCFMMFSCAECNKSKKDDTHWSNDMDYIDLVREIHPWCVFDCDCCKDDIQVITGDVKTRMVRVRKFMNQSITTKDHIAYKVNDGYYIVSPVESKLQLVKGDVMIRDSLRKLIGNEETLFVYNSDHDSPFGTSLHYNKETNIIYVNYSTKITKSKKYKNTWVVVNKNTLFSIDRKEIVRIN